MQKNKLIDTCDNCGYETLDSSEVETTTVHLAEGTYRLDVCKPNGCLERLASLAHRGTLIETPAATATAEIVATAPSTNGVGPTTCAACERTFKSEAGLRVHIARMHA